MKTYAFAYKEINKLFRSELGQQHGRPSLLRDGEQHHRHVPELAQRQRVQPAAAGAGRRPFRAPRAALPGTPHHQFRLLHARRQHRQGFI